MELGWLGEEEKKDFCWVHGGGKKCQCQSWERLKAGLTEGIHRQIGHGQESNIRDPRSGQISYLWLPGSRGGLEQGIKTWSGACLI
jgi:hypothetical protein